MLHNIMHNIILQTYVYKLQNKSTGEKCSINKFKLNIEYSAYIKGKKIKIMHGFAAKKKNHLC